MPLHHIHLSYFTTDPPLPFDVAFNIIEGELVTEQILAHRWKNVYRCFKQLNNEREIYKWTKARNTNMTTNDRYLLATCSSVFCTEFFGLLAEKRKIIPIKETTRLVSSHLQCKYKTFWQQFQLFLHQIWNAVQLFPIFRHAFNFLLQYIYGFNLDYEISVDQLFEILNLAERWEIYKYTLAYYQCLIVSFGLLFWFFDF